MFQPSTILLLKNFPSVRTKCSRTLIRWRMPKFGSFKRSVTLAIYTRESRQTDHILCIQKMWYRTFMFCRITPTGEGKGELFWTQATADPGAMPLVCFTFLSTWAVCHYSYHFCADQARQWGGRRKRPVAVQLHLVDGTKTQLLLVSNFLCWSWSCIYRMGVCVSESKLSIFPENPWKKSSSRSRM